MKFLGNLFQHEPQTPFSSISGYDDVKNIINRVLSSEENFNLLLVGPPSSAKTQFLMEIMNFAKKNCVYFDASNTTNRILQVLEEEKPDIILLDELDKLPRVFAEKLLGFLQSGRVKVDQKNCQMDFELKACKVFGTANEIDRISKPLQSRFMRFYLSKYTAQEFLNVSEAVLPKLITITLVYYNLRWFTITITQNVSIRNLYLFEHFKTLSACSTAFLNFGFSNNLFMIWSVVSCSF